MANGNTDNYAVAMFEKEVVTCGDPIEIARRVKLAFKKMSGEMALACFAKVMTAELPHPIKVAVWDAVRYSHIWWGVDEVLKGDVMNNPIVQQAFADAVPMRRFRVANRLPGWEITQMTVPDCKFSAPPSNLQTQIFCLVSYSDEFYCEWCAPGITSEMLTFVDHNGNNILWYLTYRDDQNAQGGFACPCIERELLRLGADPNHRNNNGLCWNDVRRHIIRPEI